MSKKPRGSIHKIREFELEKIQLIDEFDILQIVGEGWFGKILLVEHRASQTEMVLKAVPKPYVSLRDFYREFHYGLHLGIHRNIVTTYDVAFETAGFYVFTQEYAPLGDLTSNVTETGVGETYSKRVAKQIASALDYMHSKDIVHRDVKLDNVLIYRSDFSRVKLCDFGESFQAGTIVERRNEWLPYSPPEVLEVKPESTYQADPSHDVWQFAIVIFVCLTGCLPWQKASSDDPRYMRYLAWQGSMMLPIRRTPKLFKLLSSRAQRMFRRFLEPRPDRRPRNLSDLSKFLDDRWLAKTAEKEMAEYESDELCPSMYSFHSSPDEKHRLLYSLADCGIETNVDRQTKKNRIKDWIESSIIAEEDEDEEENNSASPSSSVSREPVPGHISSVRAQIARDNDIKTTLKDASQKHFDPRTGALQQGPSEMGAALKATDKSGSPALSNMSLANNQSLNSSVLTLGSRQDLLSSNIHLHNSEMNLPHLGEHDDFHQYLNISLSSSNLLTAPEAAVFTDSLPIRNSIGVGTRSTTTQKSILQRSKSDSVTKALYASTPTITNTTSSTQISSLPTNQQQLGQQNPNAPNGSSFFVNAIPGARKLDKENSVNNSTKSVTFTGLANAYQSLATISLPANASMQRHQPIHNYYNGVKTDSQVRSSSRPSSTSETPPLTPLDTENSGHRDDAPTYSSQVQPTQSQSQSQQATRPRVYTGAPRSTQKDTAYDRIAITHNRRR